MQELKEKITWNKKVLRNILKERYKEVLNKNGEIDEIKLARLKKTCPDIKLASITKLV